MNNKIELLKIKIAEELRKLRAEKDLSLEAVINGINELVRYEKGSVLQSLDKLTIILDFYEVKPLYFFNLVYENMYRNEEDYDEYRYSSIIDYLWNYYSLYLDNSLVFYKRK